MICEKCWGDAYMRHLDTGKTQHDCYLELLQERKDNPCPKEDQGILSLHDTDGDTCPACLGKKVNNSILLGYETTCWVCKGTGQV